MDGREEVDLEGEARGGGVFLRMRKREKKQVSLAARRSGFIEVGCEWKSGWLTVVNLFSSYSRGRIRGS